MRKQFLLLILALGLMPIVFSQNTYIVGNAKVQIKPNTLFYHAGSFNITTRVTEAEVVVNEGNIKIEGGFDNKATSAQDAFVNKYDLNTHNYGQVIIKETATVTAGSKFIMEKPVIDPQTFDWGQFSIPFTYQTANDAMVALFGRSYVNGSNRYYHSMMRWDNMELPEFDHLLSGTEVQPTDYIVLNLMYSSPGIKNVMLNNQKLNYFGVPANSIHEAKFKPSIYPNENWSVWKDWKNNYNERYRTYIEDPVRNNNTDENFGKYIFQFGNPYTSNLDLSFIGLPDNDSSYKNDGVYIPDLQGVTQYTEMAWSNEEGVESGNVRAVSATFNGSGWAGNPEALIVRPFQPFTINLRASTTNTGERIFKFSDGLKVFSSAPALSPTTGPLNPQDRSRHGATFADLVSANLTQTTEGDGTLGNLVLASSRLPFYQLQLDLFTENDHFTGNSVYIAVSNLTVSGQLSALESNYYGFENGLFVMQENPNGEEVTEVNQIMQINAIPHSFVGKPIPLGIKFPENNYNGYFLKANLFYKDIFSKLSEEEINFDDGNTFLFYDKVQDVLLPITTNFMYYIERTPEDLDLRYVIYWNDGPENSTIFDKLDVSDELTHNTVIYKDADSHKIKFNKTWKTAEVKVYDLTGRLIYSKSNVRVSDGDYVLDLPKNSTYVVKLQSENGEVYTKKIIK